MKLIIPMAGLGKRMRPHTLAVPKPLLKIAGKSIIERLIELLVKECKEKINEIHYVIGNFGLEVEYELKELAKKYNADNFIYYQEKALGTAHAVYCAKSALQDEVIVAFADTLFIGNIDIKEEEKNIIWTMEVNNPELYGVILEDKDHCAIKIVEKPKERISNKAIIGVYYFKNGEVLMNYLKKLIENENKNNNEYQLTDALIDMINDDNKIKCKTIDNWMDCGNKEEFLKTNKEILKLRAFKNGKIKIEEKSIVSDDIHYGCNITIIGSKIKKYVSIGNNCIINNSTIQNCILGNNVYIESSDIKDSIIGNNSNIKKAKGILNLGDYSSYEGI